MALIIHDLYKSYGDFSLQLDIKVGNGETLVLAGPSGCGKTTALQLISGLIEADRGSVSLDGIDVTISPPWQRNIAMVFQDLALFPHLNAGRNIAYGPAIRGSGAADRKKIVEDTLSLVHLSGYEKRRIYTLSGGEKQRVAIARALAYKPGALLFDEPFSSLDTPLRRELRENFLEIRKELQIPCILVTHDREEAAVSADHIAVMDQGRIVETGTPRDLFLFPKTKKAAEFFGFGQVFSCSLKQRMNNMLTVHSPLGDLEISAGKVPETGDLFLFVPKDALKPAGPANHQNRNIKAFFIRAMYQGDSLVYEVELPGGQIINIDADLRERIPAYKDTIELGIDEALIHFVE